VLDSVACGDTPMAFPNFNNCIVCDIVRPELNGKLILLGFYGFTPNVLLTISDINRPLVLSILACCPPISEVDVSYECSTSVVRPDGVGVFQTPPMRLAVAQGRGVSLPLGFSIAPPILPGRYAVRITVNGDLKMDSSFSISAVAPPDPNRQNPRIAPN